MLSGRVKSTYFDQLIAKEGETVSHYVHSFESSRNSTTNLKVSKWAAAANLTVVVRSQGKVGGPRVEGLTFLDTIIILTKTAVIPLSVIKWKDRYYDILIVDEQYWKSNLQYYKATCQERLEFLGS